MRSYATGLATTVTSPVEVSIVGKREPLKQLLDQVFVILDAGQSLDELSSLNYAGLLYEIAARIKIEVFAVAEGNTFWKRVLIRQSLEECANEGDRSIDRLRCTISKHIATHSERTTLASYTFVVPTRMSKIDSHSIAGLNSQLEFHSKDNLPSHLDMVKAFREGERIFRANGIENYTYLTFIQLEVIDQPLHQAISEAEREVKVLRACLTMTEPDMFHIQSSGKWTPSYPFPAPPFMFAFDNNGTYLNLFYEPMTLDYQRLYKTKNLLPDQLNESLKVLERIKLLSPSVQKAVLRPLLLYQNALDLPFPQLAFLGMWQALESIIPQRLSYDDRIRMISSLLGPGTSSARRASAIFRAIKNKRNNYIHLADDRGIDDMDCNWLRLLLRRILLRLINNGHEFKDSQTLIHFLTHYRLGKEDLLSAEEEAASTIAAIDAIRRARKV